MTLQKRTDYKTFRGENNLNDDKAIHKDLIFFKKKVKTAVNTKSSGGDKDMKGGICK